MSSGSKIQKKVFVHIDAGGVYLGNGGLNMLVGLAQEIANLGHDTFVFNPQDSLKWADFDWLCRDDFKFDISSVDSVFSQSRNECIIISSWLQGLLYSGFGSRLTRNTLLNRFGIGKGITVSNIRYWDQSELLRSGSRAEKVRRFCLKNCSVIAINNITLEKYYRSMGFKNIIPIENWIRSDLFYPGDSRVIDSIGHQSDRENYYVYNHLVSHYGEDRINLCEGSQVEVAENMKKSDCFVFFNYPSPSISLFKGEVCGLSLLEAMACGCICIAIEHEGNQFLKEKIVLIQDINEIIPSIESLLADLPGKEELRGKSISFIEENYRFNKTRRENLIKFLE